MRWSRSSEYRPRPVMLGLILIVGLLAAVALSACGGGDDDSTASGQATETSSSTAEAPALKGEPVKTLTFADLNSQGPTYPGAVESAKLYEKYVNDRGGIGGRPLEVETCDAKGSPTAATACVRRGIANGAVAVLGAQTFATEAYLPILEAEDTAYLQCCAAAPIEFTSPVSFNLSNQPLWAAAAVERGVEEGCEQIGGVIFQGAETFEPILDNAAKAMGTEIVKYVTLPATAQDYAPQVAEITDGTDCLMMIVPESAFIPWNTAMAQAGQTQQMYGPFGNLNEKTSADFIDLSEGDIAARYGWADISDPAWSDFNEAIEEYGYPSDIEVNSPTAMGAWLAYSVFADVAGQMKGTIDHETFLKALSSSTAVDTGGKAPPFDFTQPWGANGGLKEYYRMFNLHAAFSKIEGGKVVPMPADTEIPDVSNLALGEPRG